MHMSHAHLLFQCRLWTCCDSIPVMQVSHGSTMFLYNMDWAMEWPRPLPPNVQLVGALLPTPAKPLPPSFEVRAAPQPQDPPQTAL